jgi:outer membrane PBP1 activator LpoA protein
MAAISRRPRLALVAAVTLALLAAACSLVKPVEAPLDGQERAARLVRESKHAEAAKAYADLAVQFPADSDNYQLLSAEQSVAAGDVAAAKRALAAVSADARTKLPTARALVAAEVAYAENDAARAIRELDSIPVPTVPDQAQNYYWIRGRGAFMTGHPVEGTRALVERERYLSDAAALKANRDELYAKIRDAAERGTPLKAPPKTETVVLGWLDLGPVAVELERNPMRAAAALANWKRAYPQHPANEGVITTAQTQITVATEFPDQIALLLPLSGRSEVAGVAVRDGFIAAYLEQEPAKRPHLKIYDVAAEPIAAVYNRAISDGAGFIVGPLTKEDVAAIAPLSVGKTPVLALNFLADTVAPARNFYQFSLLPEDEARMVARRVVADGRPAGVAIVPGGELGNRVLAAFSDELKRLGGTVLDSQRYDTSQPDFSEIIKQILQVKQEKIPGQTKPDRNQPYTHRADANFVFISGSAAAARLIMPQLRFHYAGDVPVYATSDSFEPDTAANADIEGMLFPDMPWMVSSDAVTAQIRDGVRGAWPTKTARRDRLYAFGFDAYRLLPTLQAKVPAGDIAGVTGQLHIDEHYRVRRDLSWAQIKGGVPTAL